MDIVKWVFSFTGHLGLWFVMFNHVHATAWPRHRRKILEKSIFLVILLPSLWVLLTLIGRRTFSFESVYLSSPAAYYYGWSCIFLGLFFTIRWVVRKLAEKTPEAILSSRQQIVDVSAKTQKNLFVGSVANIMRRVPSNQATCIALESKTIALKNCPPELDGLRICQLSDLHFMGHLLPDYFKEVVAQANHFAPDIILITGDIVDEKHCLDWIGDVLGGLVSRQGKFYVLGNHDRRIPDETEIHKRMEAIGFTHVGGRWENCNVDGAMIQLAGNEMPWYSGAENLVKAESPQNGSGKPLKILLSHSPDQMSWAMPYEFDMMFAGHTHGGQIRLPVIGPLVAPSKHGVKYCSGTFQIGKMLMHVSRGISGDDPIRIDCPPELGLFTIQSSKRVT